ncbi:MAG TPA: PEP-CTERM sorting domain-containing protein [Phycisphaerae bacterium]|nr:PEP-CTERM sorting domain-containing protein [Phycisphaerae bacterium]
MTGTGTINIHGLVSDVDLVFDSTHGLQQTLILDSEPNQNITINLDVSGGDGKLGVGVYSNGTMTIRDGVTVFTSVGYIGDGPGSTGIVTVEGTGSTWTNANRLQVGEKGNGILSIINGGSVNTDEGKIGNFADSSGEVTVDGTGSTWTNSDNLYVGRYGSGVLNITSDGLVSVGGILTINLYGHGGFINMASGGMLALLGNADDSLGSFLGLVNGTDAIRYWDYPLGDWDDIASATLDEDYTLMYYDSGDLAGYTILTVLEPVLLVGDANRDGVVSADDYASVQGNFGEIGIPGIHGDATGDGMASADDYGSVQVHFGDTAGMGGVPVPEPATLSLLVIGGVAMLKRRCFDPFDKLRTGGAQHKC